MMLSQAMRDDRLFGPWFRPDAGGRDTWAPWEAAVAASMGEPLRPDQMPLYTACTGRTDVQSTQYAEVAWIIGRRGGKSRILATIAVYLATFRDYTPYLAPGEKATVAIICADRKQARTITRYCNGLIDRVPMLSAMVMGRDSESITLNNSVIIEVATASFRVTRGYTLVAAICDEVAFFRTDDGVANPDTEIFRALRPSMATIPRAMLIYASSPYQKRGVLYEALRRNYGVPGARVLVWKASSATMNHGLDPAFIEGAYADDPAAAASELGAEFRDDISDFVSRDAVEGCVVPGRLRLPRSGGHQAFVDLAGGGADSFVLAIAHRGADGTAVLDMTHEIRGPSSPETAVMTFAALLKEYSLVRVTGDRYAAEWPVERFRAHGIIYEQSEKTKGEIYRDCLPLILSGRVELTDDHRLVGQFCGLERRTARGGRDSIDHAPSGHDDLANAAAGALLLAAGKRSAAEIWQALAA